MADQQMVAWLEAQIDRVEQTAQLAQPGGYEPDTWHIEPTRSGRWVQIISKSRILGEPPEAAMRDDDQPVVLVAAGRTEQFLIALHDPAAVLRRVAADRQILAEHAPGGMASDRDETECRTCSGPTPGFSGSWPMEWPCRTVRLLAEAYGWEQQ